MKTNRFLWVFSLLFILGISGGCKRLSHPGNNPDTSGASGHVKLTVDGSLVFDKTANAEDGELVIIRNSDHALVFSFNGAQGKVLLGGVISNVPDPGGSHIVTSNVQSDDESGVALNNETGEIIAPDGWPLKDMMALSGSISRPQAKKVIVEGRMEELTDIMNIHYYNFRLEIDVARIIP